MHKGSGARVDRRRFLGLGVAASLIVAAGCENSTEPGKPLGAPLEKGNRNRLLNRKPAETPSKSKKTG
jgi:hypothetical protein